jgi:hypothetical protein
MPGLANTCRRWVFTVCGEMYSRLATAPFVSPSATSSGTARLVSVRLSQPPAGRGGPAGRYDGRAGYRLLTGEGMAVDPRLPARAPGGGEQALARRGSGTKPRAGRVSAAEPPPQERPSPAVLVP